MKWMRDLVVDFGFNVFPQSRRRNFRFLTTVSIASFDVFPTNRPCAVENGVVAYHLQATASTNIWDSANPSKVVNFSKKVHG